MSFINKKFGTPYMCVERGGGHVSSSNGFVIFEFNCFCGKPEINCVCIKNKKWVSDKTSEEFGKLNLPTHGEKIFY